MKVCGTVVLDEIDRTSLARLVAVHGDRKAARLLEIAPATLARAMAPLSIARGTAALIRQNLPAALEAAA